MKKIKAFIKKHSDKFFIGYIVLICSLLIFLCFYESRKSKNDIAFASWSNASYSTTVFNPFNNISVGVQGLSDGGIVSIPFVNLNNSNVSVSPFAVTYFDDYINFSYNYGVNNGITFGFHVTNTWVDVLMLEDFYDLFFYEIYYSGGYTCSLQLSITYLTKDFLEDTDVYITDLAEFTGGLSLIETFPTLSVDTTTLVKSIDNVDYVYISDFSIYFRNTFSGGGSFENNIVFPFVQSSGETYSEFLSAQKVLTLETFSDLNTDVDIFNSLFQTVNNFLSIEIVPNFTFGDILSFAVVVPLVIWLLKAWLGG